jgi:glycosyltransferase involved in cell wall biosynthesis
MPKITYALVTLNRLEELQFACRRVSPWVDRTVIVDGGSEDGTLEWLASQEAKDLKIEFKVSKQYRYAYGNHTPKERNQYLEMAGADGWILVTDTDEFLEEEACKNLRSLVERAEAQGIDGLMFRAHDLWSYEDGQVYDNLSSYYHHSMLFKAYPGMTYTGHTHSGIHRPGCKNRWAKTQYEYLHVKHERTMWRNDTYMWWTSAKVADNVTDTPEWLEFHELMRRHGHVDWHEFNKEVTKGNLPQDIKNWFIAKKDSENPQERAWFVHYFIFMHPEENVGQLSNRDKSFDYVEQCRLKREARNSPSAS